MKSTKLLHLMAITAVFLMAAACSSKEEEKTIESKELYRIQVGGKCGFINENGQLVIEPQFDKAYWYFGDSVCFAEVGERKGLINVNGEFVAELDNSVRWVQYFKNGVAKFYATNGKEGVINKSGEIILPAEYKTIERDRNYGFIVTDLMGNMGYADNNGQFIVPCEYDAVNGFNDGLMLVATSNKCGYVDTTGAWVIDTVFNDARSFGDELARVKVNDRWRFIDCKGGVVENLDFDDVLTGFGCNRAFVKQGDDILMIDKSGNSIAIIDADSVFSFSENYATFKKSGKFGKIDTSGVVVVPANFEKLNNTLNGLSAFIKKGKEGCIDSVGNVIIAAIHENITIKKDKTLISCADDNWKTGTLYDRNGNLVWKDMNNGYNLPEKPNKDDYIKYFDSRMAELDPIEGLYFVTYQEVRENMETGHVTPSGKTETDWYAVKSMGDEEYGVFNVNKPGFYWLKKFVRIRESNIYAVTDIDTAHRYAEDCKLTLNSPSEFDILLRISGNGSYNWYHRYEFIKEFPSSEAFEQVQQAEWTGTGFAIADGFVVTNNHVVSGAKRINVKGVGGDMKNGYKGFVVATDIEHDLAVIKIVDKKFDGFGDIPYCIGKTLPEVGDDIFVLGYPLTQTMGNDVKVTDGIISAASGYKGDQSMYQISAAVQPGNSGGPLFDSDGNVIGVIRAKHTDAENVNYAIKISYLYSLINSSGLGIKMNDSNKVKGSSLSKKVKQVKPFVYLIECSSR